MSLHFTLDTFLIFVEKVNLKSLRVQGGEQGQILLRAYSVYISDFEPYKSGSLPESSLTNLTPDNFDFHTKLRRGK